MTVVVTDANAQEDLEQDGDLKGSENSFQALK